MPWPHSWCPDKRPRVLGAASVGLLYVPAAVAMVIAMPLGACHVTPARSQDTCGGWSGSWVDRI